jgi:spore coat polysaccharide biosynthesis protein SpsF
MRAVPGIILQARVASKRLPGKALLHVGGRSILEQCLRRLVASGVPRVVLATTDREDDDVLAALAEHLGVPVFRGSEHDVLDRYVRCASHFDIDPVIRATGDNPGVDVMAAERLVSALQETRADYVMEEGLPYGAAVEGIRASALGVAALLARDPFDREHVTTFVRRRHDLFKIVTLQAPPSVRHPEVKVTVDTVEDLQHVRGLYARAGREMPSLEDLIAAATDRSQSEVA